MADPISGVVQGAISQALGGAERQPSGRQAPGRSFESVLRQGGNNSTGAQQNASAAGQPPTGVSGAQLEQMRINLMQRIDHLAPGTPNIQALLPELIDSRTRLGLLREAMNGMGGRTPHGTDLRGRFAQVENEWYQLEAIMKSSNDLSPGELLGLQARLYQVSQHVEVLSKVVDQVTGGIKTILNTNV
jgi:hypothetical protein